MTPVNDETVGAFWTPALPAFRHGAQSPLAARARDVDAVGVDLSP